jgi:hypothetical protein
MNRLLRAVDENENFYNVDNYKENTPMTQVKTYEKMQDEAFRIQKDMFIRIQDLKLLDLSEDDIDNILKKSGVSSRIRGNLLDGVFTPVNYSKARFQTKVDTIDQQLRKENKEDIKYKFRLNEDYVFPIDELDTLKDSYFDKRFFERGNEYDPEKFDYKLDKKGNMILDEEGNPVRDEGLIKKGLRFIPEVGKKLLDKYVNPLTVQAPPLPNTPMPVVKTASAVNPNTNLTRTEEALLSPEEKVIAGKRIV